MEKSTSRARRNGNNGAKDKAHKPEAGTAETTAPTATMTPGQKAKQRIIKGNATAMATLNPPRGLQDTFVDERNDVLAVINELEDQLDRHQEIRETLERDLTTTSEKLQTANQRAQELEWQVVTLQTRVDALEQVKQEVTSLEEELGDANARALRAGEQFTTAEKERSRLKTELKAANKQLDELWAVRKERDGLRSDYKTLSARVEEFERTQREMIEQRSQLQAELQEALATLEATRTERNQFQMEMRSREDHERELIQVQETMDDKIGELRTEKKSLQAQIAHLERENSRLVEQRQFYECEVTSLRNQGRSAETALASVKKAFTEVRVALTETKIRARRRTLDTWPRIGTTTTGTAESPTDMMGPDVDQQVDELIPPMIDSTMETDSSTNVDANAKNSAD